MIGPIKGMVEKDFLLTGSREDPRSSGVIKFIDYERLIFDSSRLVSNKYSFEIVRIYQAKFNFVYN